MSEASTPGERTSSASEAPLSSPSAAITEPLTITMELSKAQCAVMLGSHSIGRLCVVEAGYPVAFPVNYRLVVDADGVLTIILRTRPGNALDRPNENVGFQIDGTDPIRQTGWSVICRGELRDVRSSTAPSWLQSWDPHPWIGPRESWLYLTVAKLTGRELVHPNNDWAANDHGYL